MGKRIRAVVYLGVQLDIVCGIYRGWVSKGAVRKKLVGRYL